MDTKGLITGIVVTEHHEPYGNFSIDPPQFSAQFKGKDVRDRFRVGTDVDAVSRASITMGSATRAIRNSARRIARHTSRRPTPRSKRVLRLRRSRKNCRQICNHPSTRVSIAARAFTREITRYVRSNVARCRDVRQLRTRLSQRTEALLHKSVHSASARRARAVARATRDSRGFY